MSTKNDPQACLYMSHLEILLQPCGEKWTHWIRQVAEFRIDRLLMRGRARLEINQNEEEKIKVGNNEVVVCVSIRVNPLPRATLDRGSALFRSFGPKRSG